MFSGLLKPFLKGYFLLEEGYYDALDAIEEKFSVPVYDWFVNPLEKRGIPSFLVFLLLVLALFSGSLLVLVSFGGGETSGLQVLVYGKTSRVSGQPLDNAVVQLLLGGRELSVLQTRRGLAEFPEAPKAELTVSVSKAGFAAASATVDTSQTGVLRLELTCLDQSSCAQLEAAAGFGAPSGPVPQKPLFNTILFETEPGGVDPASPTGRLLLLVRDAEGTLLDATATVVDAESQARIDTIPVSQGAGILSGLSVGRRVYVNIMATGHLSFFGGNESFVIQPATNKLTIILEKAGPGDLALSGVRVVDQAGTPIAGARVNLHLFGHAAILYTDYSDEQGSVSIELANGTYFASASKDGHLTNNSAVFEAGQTVTVVLPSKGNCADGVCENEAQVLARVSGQDGAAVAYADVVLQQITDFGGGFVVAQTYSGYDGTALFTSLLPQSNVSVLASDYDRRGSANATLLQGVNEVNVTVSKAPFLVKAYAVDALSRTFVQAASFEAFAAGQSIGSCQGNGCDLPFLSATDVNVSVSADGFVGSSNFFYLYEGVDQNITLFLVNATSLNDTFVQWLGIYADNGRPSGDLVPGKSYQVRLGLFNAGVDPSGVVLDTGYDGAYIAGVAPAGFYQKGGYSQSCFGGDLDFGDFAPQSAWADVRYNGAVSGPVAFNLTIDSSIQLDAATKTRLLNLSYRSYGIRNNDFLRNPFDGVLGVAPDSSHPSGCPGQVAAYVTPVTVKSVSTTCSEDGCVSLDFSQGFNRSFDGLDVQSLPLIGNQTPNFVHVFYTVEFFRPPTNARIQLSGPETGILWYNATTPILGDGLLEGSKRCDFRRGLNQAKLNASFSVDLSEISQCSNFGLPLRFEGVAVGRPLAAGRANVTLSLVSGPNTTSHSSHVNIRGYGVSANRFGIVEARLSQENNANADAEPFSALSTGECSADQVAQGACDVGFLEASVSVTALDDTGVSVGFASGSGLSLRDQSLSSAVPLSRGQRADASARFLVPANQSTVLLNVTKSSGAAQTTLSRSLLFSGGVALNGSTAFPPGWDTCQGFVGVRYDPTLNPPFSLGSGCTDLGFRVSGVFPADAVLLNLSIPDFGRIVTRASQTDGSDLCYEVCEVDASNFIYGCEALGKSLYNGQQYLLRYNPELRATCPVQYKVNGNVIAGSEIQLEFAYTGDQTAKRNVTLHVLNDSSDSNLFISPVYTFYGSGSGVLYPQLWAVTNLKQLGKRTIVFKQPSNMAVKFDGPGTKVVAIVPGALPIQAYDGVDLDHPVFDSTSASSPMTAVSRYALSLFSIQQSVDLNIPGFSSYAQALANLAALSFSENAFLDVAAADRLSASVPKLAERTAYWRSNDVVRYCQTTQSCVDSAYTLGECCRDSLEDWKNNTLVQDFSQQQCTFCNNTYNPDCREESDAHNQRYLACTESASASVFQCDQRCIPQDTLRTLSPFMGQAMDAAGMTGPGVTLLDYGETLGGQTCEVRFSSLVPFVERSPNFFAYYNPAEPRPSLYQSEFSRCTASPNCPLVIQNQTSLFGGASVLDPACVDDANDDGLWQAGELLFNATAGTELRTQPGSFGGSGRVYRVSYYSCAPGTIVAVNESAFFAPAVQGGVLVSRNVVTAADVARCRDGLCPMVINPATAPISPNTPICFTGPTENGFVNARTAPASQFVAAVPDGFGGFQCPSGRLAVANFCFSSCQNACAAPSCDPSPLCTRDGVRHVPSGQARTVFNGWLNQSPVEAVRVDARFLSRGIDRLPGGWFSDAYLSSSDSFQNQAGGAPVFSASYVINSKNVPGGLSSIANLVSYQGCGPGSNYPYDATRLANQGLYVVRDYNAIDATGVNWLAEAQAASIGPADYLGARADICRKSNWNTQVCETTFVDRSSPYGSCFNSILQYSGGPKRPGVDLDLVGGLGGGIKQGVGYAVAPDGQVFALADAGQHYANICGGAARGIDPTHSYTDKNKYNVDKQTLHHWNADGRYTSSRDFYWQRDLGCSKDCGKCGGGGYGLLSILLSLVFIVVAIFAAPALGGIFSGGGAVGAGAGAGALATGVGSVTGSVLGGVTGVAAGISTGTLTTILTTVASMGASSLASGSMVASPAISVANIASNVIATVGAGNIGDCLPWAFGTATAYACKGVLWTLGAG